MNWYFIFFAISGFCSVLYELVWLRLSMAQFGVTTAMVSIVLSVFMAGLGLGSWASGRLLRQSENSRFSALRLYALIELLIGLSGLVVPSALLWGRRVLESHGPSSSFAYYFVAGLWVAVTLIPWCALMGATVPVAMRAIGQTLPAESGRSFSYLYMANVAGAVAGTTIPLFLIELLGFRGTLKVGVACNCLIAISALALSRNSSTQAPAATIEAAESSASATGSNKTLALLFLSGLTCMAMEVVWVRQYTPYLGTMVYAFASILAVYLLATFIGSVLYRRWSNRTTQAGSNKESPVLWSMLATSALLPLIATKASLPLSPLPRLALGITLFTGLLGFITPMLVDRFSAGNPAKAGTAYAVNVAGCILGPLLAGFGLLPFMSQRMGLILLTIPWLIVGLVQLRPGMKLGIGSRAAIYAMVALAAILCTAGKGNDEEFAGRRILRDSTATVMATGTGMDRQLLVNGYGMTSLTPITKVMAHLPLAFLGRAPRNALVICFGMGTTFRSLRSWGIPVIAVELVPSVPRLFDYYHSDGQKILESPLSHVVIDDGRRFLERNPQQYDVITVDPPPPLEAAGSSMLYSEEFYRAAKRRLRPGGILQQWFPADDDDADPEDVTAIARSVRNSFPYVRAFYDDFGIHFICSEQPIPNRTAKELAQRLPADAATDFLEWADFVEDDASNPGAPTPSSLFDAVLHEELSMDRLVAASPSTPPLSDDRPINEYNELRHWLHPRNSSASNGSH